MNNFQKQFADFNSTIKLSASRKEKIDGSRRAVRDRVRRYFSDVLSVTQPKFCTQGSFQINTALNPVGDEQVDLDDGLYLTHLSDDPETWISPQEAHDLIVDAMAGHTQDECVDKSSCVRVVYRNFYHVDLPIYVMHEEKAMLANTKHGEWVHSDAKEFRDWFYSARENEQTSRLIRYMKAWRDQNKVNFKSIAITVFVAKFSRQSADRDDLSLLETVDYGLGEVQRSTELYEPVAPGKDLWSEYSQAEKRRIIDALRQFKTDLSDALYNPSFDRAVTILREAFGDRFPPPPKSNGSQSQRLESGAQPWGFR